ncbi:HD domain-containing protein [Paenibacillus sp. y28]|uniref:HD domain-containing protein n=1 Tax=Paenibacillus sp. y28 TaxID=3129110 RepID=UPI00301B0FF2
MSTLTEAIMIAAKSHEGQLDKGGQPYILHPLRVMLQAGDTDTRIVAVLHDVVEDSDCSLEELRQAGFHEHIIAALDCLTRRPEEAYEAFLQRIRPNKLAAAVKRLDLEDNMNLDRIPNPTEQDYERLSKYKHAVRRLSE